MKELLLAMLLVLTGVAVISAKDKAEITFTQTSHDFGTIKANDGAVSAVYEFTNTGTAPLTIITVTNGGCGCTKLFLPQTAYSTRQERRNQNHLPAPWPLRRVQPLG